MAVELWNRVNVPFPSAVSAVRVPFTAQTAADVETLLTESENVLKLVRSEILQTEVRLLYELLYVLNNSYRGNKTFKALKQVEQCANRLKNMKLDAALQELSDLCPNRIQRQLSIKDGQCFVPSQPRLEWICLKVLGAARLMSCALSRCSRAFTLSKQQMKWEEFVILNVVITSMLSRLWVIFRGVLLALSGLYRQLLELLGDVARAQPMPFLTDFSLPADLAQFLGSSDALLLTKHPAHSRARQEKKQAAKKLPAEAKKTCTQKRKLKEDLGVAVKRGVGLGADRKSFFKLCRTFAEGKSTPKQMCRADRRHEFQKRVREAASFSHMEIRVDEMIRWCKSQRMGKEKRLLTFLRLKCRQMKCLEAAGYNVQRKLQTFKKEACWASSPEGSAPKTLRSLASRRRSVHGIICFHSLRRRFMMRGGVKKKEQAGRQRRARLSGDDQRSRTAREATHRSTDSDTHDDIDDIFASAGL
ncbi:nucleolus and neural progenitor protein [Oreochromis aureus]|uniref:Nucleolus and neural progenitor protein-like N-terminal domain-containing protein n=1 Tax=Oreochromis aureus TaxID=47969 RepID=A0A668TDX3_OREAU|nr:nucleolus and neural progenitor protein [Oreochromis aureus]